MHVGGRARMGGLPFEGSRQAGALVVLVAGVALGAGLLALHERGGDAATQSAAAGRRAAPPPIPAPRSPAAPAQDGYASVVRAVMPAVVNISSVQVIQWDPLESTCRHASLSIL